MKLTHIFLALLVALFWGVNFSVMKIAIQSVPPILFTGLRGLVVASLALFIRKPNVSWTIILSLGTLIGMAKFGCLLLGMHYGMPAGLASIVLQTQSLFSVLIALCFFKEVPKINRILGMGMAFIGMFLIAEQIQCPASFIGFLLVLLAALFWALSNILIQKSNTQDMLGLVVWFSLVPPIPLFLGSYIFEGPDQILQAFHNIRYETIILLLSSSLFSIIGGYSLWGYLLKRYSIAVVAPFSLLVPIFGLSTSYFCLEEQFSERTLLGVAIVIIGLAVNQLRKPAFLKKS